MTKSYVLLVAAFVTLGAVVFTGCATWQEPDGRSSGSYPPPNYGGGAGGGGHHH